MNTWQLRCAAPLAEGRFCMNWRTLKPRMVIVLRGPGDSRSYITGGFLSAALFVPTDLLHIVTQTVGRSIARSMG
jgi:hypothetical protein